MESCRNALTSIARALSLPAQAMTLHANAYVSAAGNGLMQHFDGHEVIVLQLYGRKIWRFARNSRAIHPIVNYVAGDPVPDSPEFRGCVQPFGVGELQSQKVVELEMSPGTILFLPRGYWHETTALDDCVSVTLGVYTPSWREIVVGALNDLMGELDQWRRPAMDAFTSSTAARHIQCLLADLDITIDREDAEELIDRFRGLRQRDHMVK
jgi:50S ribosomal protein L16 3-hydroxylase